MQIGEGEGFWANWGNVQWVITAIGGAVVALSGFAWKLSSRVLLLEEREELRDKLDKQRHEENVHLQRGVQMRIDALTNRIDRWFGGRKDI